MALAWPGVASAASPAPPASREATEKEEVLDEVSVEGRRGRQVKPQQSFDWLARLVGEFRIDGYVLPYPLNLTTEAREARGQALCVGFGVGPGVQCELRVHWPEATGPKGEEVPGGASRLDPAIMVFGFNLGSHSDPMRGGLDSSRDPESFTIAHIMVDNSGVAESGAGFRVGTDTMTSRAPCVAITENCERLVQISAPEDLKTVDMLIDLEVDGEVAMRYDFVLHRVEESTAVVYGRKAPKGGKK